MAYKTVLYAFKLRRVLDYNFQHASNSVLHCEYLSVPRVFPRTGLLTMTALVDDSALEMYDRD